MHENNNPELNNPAPAPIPEPLPELRRNRLDGGFSGAANRFCSNEIHSPVEKMPDFTIGKNTDTHKSVVNKAPEVKAKEPEKEPVIDFEPLPVEEKSTNTNNEDVTVEIPSYISDNKEILGKFNVPETKKKSKAGAVVVISILTAMLILAGVFFGVELVNSEKKSSSPFENLNPTENSTVEATMPNDYNSFYEEIIKSSDKVEDTEKDSEKYANKKWKGLSLQKKPSEKKEHSAQYSFEKVSPSTVAVMCYEDKVDTTKTPDGQGTGIIISSDGYIVTNSHVIGDSRDTYKYAIQDSKGKTYNAKVIGFDTRTDIAVMKINENKLKPAIFGKVSDLKIGDDIIAVGNPGGINFQNSLTKGIISAKDRVLPNSNVAYLQTDAAINPGNSGGPLCNLYGQVVGITTAKINSSMYEGMGFAIPSDTIKEITDNIIKNGYVKDRVKIGIVGTAISEYTSEMYNVPKGIMITSIDDESSLKNTEVKPKDIITKVGNTEVSSFSEVYRELEKHSLGDKIKIAIYRPAEDNNKKGDTFTVEIELKN